MMDCARSLGLPVLIHASEPVGHSYIGKGTVTPDLLEALVTAFPRTTYVFAHFGGGLPFYALMPEVARLLEHCYFDTAAWPFLYEPGVFEVAARAAGAEKILFGSDFPLVPMTAALAGLQGLDVKASQQVSGSNSAQLFQI
jgi:predicted TIM-barrel fold metal-dependent hydrolase